MMISVFDVLVSIAVSSIGYYIYTSMMDTYVQHNEYYSQFHFDDINYAIMRQKGESWFLKDLIKIRKYLALGAILISPFTTADVVSTVTLGTLYANLIITLITPYYTAHGGFNAFTTFLTSFLIVIRGTYLIVPLAVSMFMYVGVVRYTAYQESSKVDVDTTTSEGTQAEAH